MEQEKKRKEKINEIHFLKIKRSFIKSSPTYVKHYRFSKNKKYKLIMKKKDFF